MLQNTDEMKRIFISCLLLLGTILTSAQNGSATWMGNLPDKAFVSQLSLPGTHDAATGEGGNYSTFAKVQSKTLDEQWACGVRVFDLRVQDDDGTLNLYHGTAKCDINFADAMTKITGYVTTYPTEFAIVLLRDESNGGGKSPWNTDVATELANYTNLVSTFRADLTVGEMRGKVLVLTRDNGGTAIAGTTKMDWWSDDAVSLAATVGGNRLRVQDIYNVGDAGETAKDNGIKNLLSASMHRAAGDYTWFINHTSGYKTSTQASFAENAKRTNKLVIDEMDGETGCAGIVMMDYAGDDKGHLFYSTYGKSLVDALVAQNFKTRPYEIYLPNGDLNTNSATSGNNVEVSKYDSWTLSATGVSWKVNNSSQYCFSGRWAESWVASGSTLGDRQLSQKITLPAGKYAFSCSALTTGTGASYFIGSVSGDIADNSSVGTAQNPIYLTLSETQEVELGVKLSGYTGNWFAVDNFHLTTTAFEEKGSTANLNITPWIVANPSFDNNNSAGWTVEYRKGTASNHTWNSTSFDYYICENFENDLSLQQAGDRTLPKGYYQLRVRGFERTTSNADAYAERETASVSSWLYSSDENSVALQNIFTNPPTSSSGFSGKFYTDQSGIATPNDMQGAASVLNAGYYENVLPVALVEDGTIDVGLKVTNVKTNQWTAFDDFRLYRMYSVNIVDDSTFTPVNTTVDVVLKRKFANSENWYTLVLPFDVTADMVTTVLGNVTVAKLKDADGTKVYFSTGLGQNIEANVPVLVKGTFNDSPYRFEDVMVEVPSNGLSTATVGDFALVGSYVPNTQVPQGNYILYGGKFYYVNTDNVVVNPSRAYLQCATTSSAKTMSLVLDGEDVTAIEDVETDALLNPQAKVYDLSGRSINPQTLRRGIYIQNGRKLLVK